LPDELAHAQSRLQRLQQAKAELEQETQKQLQAATTNLLLGKRGRLSNAERAGQPVKDRQQREKDVICTENASLTGTISARQTFLLNFGWLCGSLPEDLSEQNNRFVFCPDSGPCGLVVFDLSVSFLWALSHLFAPAQMADQATNL
jgi:hypothetical protein